MKEALTIVMLVLLIGPLLVGVRRIRRLPRTRDVEERRGPTSSSDEKGGDPREV
ncbi:hypothetical protein [Sphingosinicella sp. CPCC 101087]|uniref:hypothetical protein n=1 Tax=Sphingosinicella sp. CPCC 101087 TaxID=2497754 RepID=UPI0013EA5B68|nr:hypothetical protein [Sphingosinicella sp. CPCC 101087]